ncbi:response regulator transcription factor [Oceanisphaera sp. KMM 10153]|uniref:response regulator transcription factor n=1 Tax=Oceanisphaera submarina TaxID=3390193 RepID=UPI003975D530
MQTDIAPPSLTPLARLLPTLDGRDFLPELRRCLEHYFPDIDLVLCRLHRQGRPEILLHNLSLEQYAATLQPYCTGMYLLDPFYQYWLNHPAPSQVSLDQIAPEGFRRSEYFLTYYTELGLHDELMCFFSSHTEWTLAFSFGFYQRPPHLDGRLLTAQMNYLFPLLQALLERHRWKWQQQQQQQDERRQGLATFETGRLSEREQEVAQLFLQGYSARAIADHLCISPGTVKNHRKHIYGKLGINSQAGLFQLFLRHQGLD